MKIGKIYFITGPMFSGKTTKLKKIIEREEIAKRDFIVFNSNLDNRYKKNCICSHNNENYPSYIIDDTNDMYLIYNKEKDKIIKSIFIDEIQFFNSDIIDYINFIIQKGINVYCSGLNLTSEGKVFPFKDNNKDIGILLAYADIIIKLKARCNCGNEADMTTYIGCEKKNDIKVGVNNYIPNCKKCWYENNKNE
jgi:thymidine kinase